MDGLIGGQIDGLIYEHQYMKRGYNLCHLCHFCGYNLCHFLVLLDVYQLNRRILTIIMLTKYNSRGKCS